jgi:hypothetical protein
MSSTRQIAALATVFRSQVGFAFPAAPVGPLNFYLLADDVCFSFVHFCLLTFYSKLPL